ncbi:hypothetical protein CYY_007024 [Polysphondylium violaceum]|uniref:Fido domain-containing protein n=1 Tax=Polysphondylium violaceum TaxID=133409 RepID=A0A8J4UXX4_9MYCE|nr:hypothetical protein CYY_007024 [Polysphondylium violaceum]
MTPLPREPAHRIENSQLKKLDNEPAFKVIVNKEYWNSAAILFVYHSNRLSKLDHSITHTTRIINSFVKHQFNCESDIIKILEQKPLMRREIIQHYCLMKEIFEGIKKYMLLSVELIQSWHRVLMDHIITNKGQYRAEEIVSENHIFIECQQIPKMMDSLVRQYNEYRAQSKQSPYALAAWLSHSFLCINPFSDGNGRLSRILENYVLFSYGFPCPVSCPTHDHEEYQQALSLADRDFVNGRNTSLLAHVILKNSNSIYNNYLLNKILENEFQ